MRDRRKKLALYKAQPGNRWEESSTKDSFGIQVNILKNRTQKGAFGTQSGAYRNRPKYGDLSSFYFPSCL